MSERSPKLARRSFLSKAGTGAAAFGAAIGAGAGPLLAQPASSEGTRFQPARHAEDDWFDRIPGKHRFFFDTISQGYPWINASILPPNFHVSSFLASFSTVKFRSDSIKALDAAQIRHLI